MQLSKSILTTTSAAIAAKNVKLPTYLNEHKLRAGILHVGVGNFHRAHLATYMDDYFHYMHDAKKIDDKDAFDWAIVGAGVMLPFDQDKRNALEPQDWLSTLVERDAQEDKLKASVIGSMIDFLPVDPPEFVGLKDKLMDPALKIVSLTVTEGGYYLDSDGNFNAKHPQIDHDAKNPKQPTTIFGLMVQALQKRREANQSPFTIMSCDNVPHNGKVCRAVVVGLAKLMADDELASWIDTNVAFPNSMVDRITPATTDSERSYVEKNLGYKDNYPVFCEPYRQWVLEDSFNQGRPAWQHVGVEFVDDVTPYETMKIRILNGGHASLCYPAALLDVDYVHEAIQHPVIGPFVNALERCEIIPTVPEVPNGVDLVDYWTTVQHRFSNPSIQDRIDRICFDGSNRQSKFIVPCIANALKQHKNDDQSRLSGLALVSVLWCRYCRGTTESGKTINKNDPDWDNLQNIAKETFDTDPKAWLGMKSVYGSVGEEEVVCKEFGKWLDIVKEHGVEAALKQYVDTVKQ